MKQKWNKKRGENATGAGSWVGLVWTKCGGKQGLSGSRGLSTSHAQCTDTQPQRHSALILNLRSAQCTDTQPHNCRVFLFCVQPHNCRGLTFTTPTTLDTIMSHPLLDLICLTGSDPIRTFQ